MEAPRRTPEAHIPTPQALWQSQWRVILTRQTRHDLEQLGLIVSDGMVQRTVERWITLHPSERSSDAQKDQ
jgi:hypothetical protein